MEQLVAPLQHWVSKSHSAAPQSLITLRQEKSIQSSELDTGGFGFHSHFAHQNTHTRARTCRRVCIYTKPSPHCDKKSPWASSLKRCHNGERAEILFLGFIIPFCLNLYSWGVNLHELSQVLCVSRAFAQWQKDYNFKTFIMQKS